MHPSHTSRGATRQSEFSQFHEVGDAGDCGARQIPHGARGRIPHGGGHKIHRQAWCKTTQRIEHGPLRGEPAQRPTVSEYDQSSAEAVATLGAASFQNGATGTGGHAMAKAVFTGFPAIIWLKGALHGASSWAKLPRK